MPTSSNSTYPLRHPAPQAVRERNIEDAFLEKLRSLKYTVRPDINDRATLVQRMLSDDRSDKVIVTTIQKLGLALDENSKRNRQKEKQGRETFKQRLEP